MNQKLYVGNLNFDATEEEVRELFGNYGTVEDVKIIMDRFSGRSRGFCFVRMDSDESANKAKEDLSGQPFQGKTLVIDFAKSEGERGPRNSGPRERGEFRPRRDFNSNGRSEGRSERRDYHSNRDNFYNR